MFLYSSTFFLSSISFGTVSTANFINGSFDLRMASLPCDKRFNAPSFVERTDEPKSDSAEFPPNTLTAELSLPSFFSIAFSSKLQQC